MKYLKYIFWSLLVIIPCTLTVLIYNDKITQNSPVYYKRGVQFYNEGNYADAYYNFSRIKWISPLYPAALFKQAKSAQKLGDYKTAAIKYSIFLKKMPSSVFSSNARLNLAKSLYYMKQYDEAKTQFEYIAQNKRDFSGEEIFFLGLIEKYYNKEKAADYFRKYIEAALSDGRLNELYASACAQELADLNLPLSDRAMKLIGTVYFKDGRHQDALKYFSKLPVSECWDYLVLSNHYSGSKAAAKKLIEEGIEQYSALAEEDNLFQIYNVYTSYLIGSRLKNWKHLEKLLKEKNLSGIDYVLYKTAEILPSDKAEEYYKEIYEKHPESRFAAEALWNVFWRAYKKHDYETAEKLAMQHLKTYRKVNSTSKTAFWLGKIYFKQNRLTEAHSIMNRLISKYPDSYYGLRAGYILGRKKNFWQTSENNKLSEKYSEIDFPMTASDINLKDLKLINTIFEAGDYEIWHSADFKDEISESWFEYKKGNKSHSIVLARNEIEKMDVKPAVSSSAYKLAYPVYMAEDINTAASKLNIDPYLILSVIREESYFNEKAKSRTGASGLMQLMPQTANYMLNMLNAPSAADIEDARTNLYLGCNYLKYLKNRFDNDLMIVAAYNGGEGSVNKWLKNFEGSDYDEFIEDIPFEETRNYVKKVFRTYRMYRKIYK